MKKIVFLIGSILMTYFLPMALVAHQGELIIINTTDAISMDGEWYGNDETDV